MRYLAALTPDTEDGGYTVAFPDFPGCFTEGTDPDDAVAMAADALASHVAGMRKSGMPVPDPTPLATIVRDMPGAALAYVPLIEDRGQTMRVNLSLDSGIVAAIDAAARERGATRSGFIAAAARQMILNG